MRRIIASVLTLLSAATLALTTAAPAQASATGCNNDVWLGIRGTGTYVETITVSKCYGTTYFYGHNHIFGGGIDANGPANMGPLSFKLDVYRHLPEGAKICGETWEHTNNGLVLRGRPCLYIFDQG